MKVETEEVTVKPPFKPFIFKVMIENEEEAEWFHDYILCGIKDLKPNYKFDENRKDLIRVFFSQLQKA